MIRNLDKNLVEWEWVIEHADRCACGIQDMFLKALWYGTGEEVGFDRQASDIHEGFPKAMSSVIVEQAGGRKGEQDPVELGCFVW